MSGPTSDQKEAARDRLREVLKRVPSSINSAGIQTVQKWKKAHADATKVANSTKATFDQIQQKLNEMGQYQ